jgi:hypothetical protein
MEKEDKTMLKPGQCYWHIGKLGDVSDAAYCRKKTTYKILKDDDDNKKRVYNVYCPEHELIADNEKEI